MQALAPRTGRLLPKDDLWLPVPAPVPPERAGLIAAQMLGYAHCHCILRLPPVVALREAEAVAQPGATVQRDLPG